MKRLLAGVPGVPGVIRADVSLEKGTAVVSFDDARADIAAITAATAEAGFPSHSSEHPAHE